MLRLLLVSFVGFLFKTPGTLIAYIGALPIGLFRA